MKKLPDIKRMESLRNELRFNDRGIFEKAIYAFRLLDELLQVYPNLIFKGGTSILLHIYPPVRLSIDIDILLSVEEKAGLKDALNRIMSQSAWFVKMDEDIRTGKIPKVHYKFQYTSQYSTESQYVLLDVVFSENPYKKILEKDLSKIPLFLTNSRTIVRVPTQEGVLGDKMTAISSKTIGIALKKERTMEVVKQIIDLGELFNIANDVNDIRQSFIKATEQENGFRGTSFSADEVLDDVADLAFKYSQFLLKGADNSFPEIKMVNEGLSRVANHLRLRIVQQDIKVSFAKIAYLTDILRSKDKKILVKTVNISSLKNTLLTGKYKVLERLKVTNPEAYFYWVMAVGTK